jgi:GT2 family glycosyltransferase
MGPPKLAIVVIGRNEGADLRRCLVSALRQCRQTVYVDSGSVDGSPQLARSLGVDVVELSSDQPYTAARARNEGLALLLRSNPSLEMVQFLDGDCELAEGWIDFAAAELEKAPELAAVGGQRRERFPDATFFNRLCDLDWNAPTGEVARVGGDAMIRVRAFRQVGGFNPALIAGEEPELSLRMRQNAWKILCVRRDMSLHDARMTSFRQLWRRMLRSGHAYAEVAWMHRHESERYWVRECLSIWLWGAVVPMSAIAVAFSAGAKASLIVLLLYPLLVLRIYVRMRGRRLPARNALLYGCYCMLVKFPQLLGQVRFVAGKCTGSPSSLIEYKSA